MLDSRLVYVVAVAKSGSFTRAANAVGVTQSAITRSIADLESEIGYTVFYRESRGVALTERGGEFVKRASRLLEDARELLKGDALNGDPYTGILRVGVCPSSLEWVLTDCEIQMLQRHPGIRFDVTSSSFETIVRQLQYGVLDVAIGFRAAFTDWADLQIEPLGSFDAGLFVRKGHPILDRSVISERDLACFDFVSPSESKPYGEIIHNLYEQAGRDWQAHVHRIDFFPAVRRLVAHSDAIGIVTTALARTAGFDRRFTLLKGVDIFPPAAICCAVRARWEPKAATRAFIAVMKRTWAATA